MGVIIVTVDITKSLDYSIKHNMRVWKKQVYTFLHAL